MYFILVTGNGFDLEHEIPSSYKNFLHFIEIFTKLYRFKDEASESKKDIFANNIAGVSSKYQDILAIMESNKDDKKKVLQEFYECVSNNDWIEYFQECLKKRAGYGKEYNWVDIEEEIANVIILLTKSRNTDGVIELNGNEISLLDTERKYYQKGLLTSLLKHIRINRLQQENQKHDSASRQLSVELISLEKNYKNWIIAKRKLLKDYQKMVRALEIYLDFIIDSSKIGKSAIFSKVHFDRVITFNYTDTYRKYYGDTATDFIHGNADYKRHAEENNLVVGIDEFLPDDQKDKDIEFIDYRKYYQRIVKKCDFNYRRYLKSEDGIITWFFGHSMAVSDKDILVHMLPSGDNKVIKSYICYHSEDAFRQQVTNLVQVLGQDRLNELVCDSKPQIVFINQTLLKDELAKCRHDIELMDLVKRVH